MEEYLLVRPAKDRRDSGRAFSCQGTISGRRIRKGGEIEEEEKEQQKKKRRRHGRSLSLRGCPTLTSFDSR